MKTLFSITVVVAALTALLFEIYASWAEISDENLVAQSDLIVVGKITAIKEGGSGAKDISIATISINDVIKGPADINKIRLAFPSKKRNQMASTDIFYDVNQEGVWLLRKDEKRDYYLADFPSRFQPIENSDKIKAIVGTLKSTEKPLLDQWKKEAIDKWIADNNLNRYGDPKDTIYMGGTPLFDEKTGSNIDRYEYIYFKHPEVRKLLVEKSKMQDNPERSREITDDVKQKIDEWIRKNDLNMFGDPKDMNYIGGTPLFNERTGKRTDRYEYILTKHPKLRKELGLDSGE